MKIDRKANDLTRVGVALLKFCTSGVLMLSQAKYKIFNIKRWTVNVCMKVKELARIEVVFPIMVPEDAMMTSQTLFKDPTFRQC